MSAGLEGLFGSAEDQAAKVAQAEDFINRYSTGDPKEGYSEEEAVQMLKGVSRVASPDQMKVALQESINNLSPDDRAQFAEMLKQRQAGAGMVDIQRSGERTAAGAGASQGGDGGAGIEDVLGGLLGGLLGGGAASGQGGSGDGLDDLLGGLLGGGQGGGANTGAAAGEADGGGGLLDMLGDFASSPTGKAVMAGAAAFAMKNILGGKG